MKRLIWFAAGLGAGAYAAMRGRRAAEVFTPEGFADRAKAVGAGLKMFRDEVAQGKVDAEGYLREKFQIEKFQGETKDSE